VETTSDSVVVIVLTTLGTEADADFVARTLITERLAACVHVMPPMTSFYRWKGAVKQDREQQLAIKTTAVRAAELEARLRELHPYELPEVVTLDATASAAYAGWVRSSVAPDA
jgi:periplasmic divalent cation tolerance protein